MKWVLVDLSFITYKAMYAVGDLEHDDIPTGVLYGFFEQLYSICTNSPVNSNKVLIFTDSKKSYRERSFPSYKKRRKEQRSEEEQEKINIMYKQINKLKNKILPKLGFPVFKQVGLESDDLIASVAQELTRRKEKGIIITSDGDLYQCITSYITWYDPGKGLLMDVDTFKKKKGIESYLWGEVKSLAGCVSDCVPGLPGIGEKTAIKYLNQEPISEKKLETILNSRKERLKWRSLTVLPHKKTYLSNIYSPTYKPKSFFSFCKHYGIMSYLEVPKKLQWIKFFEGKFKRKLKRRKRK